MLPQTEQALWQTLRQMSPRQQTPYTDEPQQQFAKAAAVLSRPKARTVPTLHAGGQAAEYVLEKVRATLQDNLAGPGSRFPAWAEAQIEATVAWLRFGGHLVREHPEPPQTDRYKVFVQLLADTDWRYPPAARRYLIACGERLLGRNSADAARDGGYEARQGADRELLDAWDRLYNRELRQIAAQRPADEGAAAHPKRGARAWEGLWTQKDGQPFTDWSELTVKFVNRETLEVGARQYTYGECGFRDGANYEGNDPPVTRAWCALAMLAYLCGNDQEITLPHKETDSRNARQVSLLRSKLCQLTGLPKDSDPLPHQEDKETGEKYWQPAFGVDSDTEIDALEDLADRFKRG